MFYGFKEGESWDDFPEFYRRTMEEHAPLPPEDEVQASEDDLVKHNLRLVFWVARRMSGLRCALEDRISWGHVGLVLAARRFDRSVGVKFATYARWWIEREVLDGYRAERSTVRLPVNLQQAQEALARLENRQHQTRGRVDDEEVAQELGCSPMRLQVLRQQRSPRVSLDSHIRDPEGGEPVRFRSRTLLEGLPDSSPGPDENCETNERNRDLRDALGTLGKREADILSCSYGLDGGPDRTLQAMAERHGVSRERIRQLRNDAQKKLRKALKNMGVAA